jgi:T5SS/PEP-CTERM-associated repeat protein
MHFVKTATVVLGVSLATSVVHAQVPFQWIGPGSGDFQDPTKWDMGFPPGPLDHAIFDIGPGIGYQVDFFGPAQTELLDVANNSVIFDLHGNSYDVTAPVGPAISLVPTIDGQLILRDGVLTGNIMEIDGGVNAELIIDPDGLVQLTDYLLLGWGGFARVIADGQLRVDGRITVGDISTGEVAVVGTPGSVGQVVNDPTGAGETVIAAQPGSIGDVMIDGPNASWTSSQIIVGGDDVMAGGVGTLTVMNGGTLDVPGVILLWGPNATLNFDGGAITTGFMDLQPGANFNWTAGTLEFEADGLTVDSTGLLGSSVTIGTDKSLILGEFMPLQVGDLDAGNLTIQGGGTVDLSGGDIFVGGFAPGTSDGILTVTGTGSRLSTDAFVFVGTGAGGAAGTLNIGPGALVDVGSSWTMVEDQGAMTLSGGTLVLDVLDVQPSGTFSSTDPATTFRFNEVTDFTQIQTFNGNLQLGHDAGFGTRSLSIVNDSLTPSGDLEVGYSDTATVDLDNSFITCADGVIGSLPGGNGLVTLNNGSNWSMSGGLTVGKEGVGVLRQNIGGDIITGDDITIGDMPNSSGDVVTDGSLLSSGGTLTIGRAGAGTLQILDGGSADALQIVLGAESTSTGDVEVDNFGNLYTDGTLEVGRAGDATLMVRGDSDAYGTAAIIASDDGSTSSVTVQDAGTLWEVNGKLHVGGDPSFNDAGGNATLGILSGGRVTTIGGHVGVEVGATGTVNVTGTDSKWINTGSFINTEEWLTVGVRGIGAVHISAGGEVESGVVGVGTNILNGDTTSRGTITVDGPGSLLDAYGLLYAGGLGTGDVTASNQAHINASNVSVLDRGTLLIETGATIMSDTEVKIGQSGSDLAQATVTGPGSDWTNTGTLDVGEGADGALIVTDHATMSTADTNLGINGGSGQITVSNSAQLDIDGPFIVGLLANGDLTIANGGRVVISPFSPDVQVGFGPSDGRIEVNGFDSELVVNNQTLTIGGVAGTGSLDILGGGSVLSQDVAVGDLNSVNSTALVDNPGSTWDVSGELKVGASAIGLVEVRDSGSIISQTGVIGAASGSNGTVNVTGSNSNWNINGLITIGRSGEGYFRVTDGGQATNSTAYIADNSGSIGQAQVYSIGSSWDTSGNVFVGGDNSGSGGAGDMTAGNGPGTGGTINIGGTLKVWAPGTVQMSYGVINAARLSTVDGTWNWGGGEFNLTDPAFEFVVGAAGPFGSSLTIPADNLMTVQGQTTVDSGAVLDAVGFTGFNRIVNEGTIKSRGNVILGDTSIYQAYSGGGLLDVNTNNVTLNSLGFLVVDFPLNLTGGTLTAPNGLLIEPAYLLSAHGTIDTRLTVPMGTTITATGNLALGEASQADGFFSDGILDVGSHTVTLADANLAVLGSLTMLGGGGSGGAVVAPNGMLIEFGKNVTGFGSIDTPDDPLTPTVNNGDVTGNSLAEPITLSGYVKGVGTFDNVAFTGTFAPGFSPATVYLGSAQYAGTLEIELGGLAQGDSDLLHHSGDLVLGGVLDVSLWDGFVPMPGSVIDFMTYAGNLSGAFSDVINSTGYAGLILGYTSDTDSVMLTTDYLLGDLNLDGFVGIVDLNIVLGNWNQTVPPGDPLADPSSDGFVGIADLNVVLGNWNAGTPPREASNIPEPGTVLLLFIGSLMLPHRRLS